MNELEQEKMKLVWQLNVIIEQIDDYWSDNILLDSWIFKELCQRKQYIEERIKFINKQLSCCE